MKRELVLTAAIVFAVAACDQARPSHDAPLPSAASAQSDGAAATSPLPAVPSSPAPSSPAASTDIAPRLTQQPRLLETSRPPEKPRNVGIYTPPAGSPERVNLMNALRDKVRGELGGNAVFVVSELRSNGEWAFASVEPQWPDGAAINPRTTPLYRRDPDWPFDGLRTEAIWKKENGRWSVVAHAIGSTDVWWLDYCNRVPTPILRGC